MGERRGERTAEPETCRLCDKPADVWSTLPSPTGSFLTTRRTDCPTCGGAWTISHMDYPLLEKESAETKRRISAKVREQATTDPDNPLVVNQGLILFCRRDR